MLKHPADRLPARQRGRFERLAERASFLASSPFFFLVCFATVAVWAVGLGLGASGRFVEIFAGAMSAMTLALVALLRNAELRSERAIHQKLDAIATSLLEQRRGDPHGDAEQELEDAIGLHEEI